MLALAAGARNPGAIANWAAGRAVAMPQACKPGCVRDAVLAGSRWARWGAWQRSLVRVPLAPARPRARPPPRAPSRVRPAAAGAGGLAVCHQRLPRALGAASGHPRSQPSCAAAMPAR